MLCNHHKHLQAVTSTSSNVETEGAPASKSTIGNGRHCAWCGDPPDENGSHGICDFHAKQMVAQAQARRRSRGQS